MENKDQEYMMIEEKQEKKPGKTSKAMKWLLKKSTFVLVVAAVAILLWNFLPTFFGDRTEETRVTVESRFGPVAELSTYEYSYYTVDSYEDYRQFLGKDIPFTGNDVVVVGEGRIKVGFDLDGIKPDVYMNGKNKIIRVNLPSPEIQDNYLEPVKYIEHNNILNPLSLEETNHKFYMNKDANLQSAIGKNIYEEAANNARLIIQTLYSDFSAEGYSVEVNIEGEAVGFEELKTGSSNKDKIVKDF